MLINKDVIKQRENENGGHLKEKLNEEEPLYVHELSGRLFSLLIKDITGFQVV